MDGSIWFHRYRFERIKRCKQQVMHVSLRSCIDHGMSESYGSQSFDNMHMKSWNFLRLDFYVCPSWKVQLLVPYVTLKNTCPLHWDSHFDKSFHTSLAYIWCGMWWRVKGCIMHHACTRNRIDDKYLCRCGWATENWYHVKGSILCVVFHNSKTGEIDNTFQISIRRCCDIHMHRILCITS